jgi:RNA polymerase sigma-70 factor (ECF subfamily)
LCRNYWFPLYDYARKQGCDLHSAQDLTQEFFGRMIEKNYFGVADRRRGRFRWFLLRAFKCSLVNEWDRSQAQNRGEGKLDRLNYLEAYLPGAQPALSQAEVGAALGLTEGAVKQEVFRIRRRFGELVREAVAQTVAHPDEIEDEISYLIDVMSRQ